MAAATVEELADDLASGITWRRSELQVFRAEAKGILPPNERTPASRALLRASVVMLYAHWEGFVKQACQAYLDFVAIRKLRYDELSGPLVATALRPMAKRVDTDSEVLQTLAGLVAGDGRDRARLPRQGVVETGSNLRHEVLLTILSALGLPSGEFATTAALIDRELCDRRNEIAHGKDSFPDPEAVEQLFDRVLGLMDDVRSLVVRSAADRAYRSD